MFENVKGLTLGQHKRFLADLIEGFREKGYDVLDPYRVLNAADFGVPQDRRRLFLIGCRRGDGKLPVYPEPCARVTVAEAIGDLPNADSIPELIAHDMAKVKLRKPSVYAAKLRGEMEDPGDFSYLRKRDPAYLTSSMRTEHTALSQERFAETEHGKTEPISRFHKLDPDGVCNTLRAGTASDRGAFTSPRPIHYQYPRVITVREAARLHSYPDWFRLHSTKWHGFRQIGNSVPPLLARAVASGLIRAMGMQPVKPEAEIELGDPRLLYFGMAMASSRFGVSADTIAKRSRPEARNGEAEEGKQRRKQESRQLGFGL